MKNSEISKIKNTLFLSDTKLKIRFKRKNMFCETTVRKWDIVTINSRLLYTIPARWTLAIAFIGLLVTTSNVTSFFVPLSVKLSGLPPSWKILHCNLLCHWSAEQICGLKVFLGWMVPDECFQAQLFHPI